MLHLLIVCKFGWWYNKGDIKKKKCAYGSVFGVLAEGLHVFVMRTLVAGRGSLQLQLVNLYFLSLYLFISYYDILYLLTARAEDYCCPKLRSMTHTHTHTHTRIH